MSTEKLWTPHPDVPTSWEVYEEQIAKDAWLTIFRRPSGYDGTGPDEVWVSVYDQHWSTWKDGIRRPITELRVQKYGEAVRQVYKNDPLMAKCIEYDIRREFGDERSQDGGVRCAGDEAQGPGAQDAALGAASDHA